jgi:hypothetical protein
MGPTRLLLSKPVIAAVSGYAVGGGFELALWCDLRIAERDAVFGAFDRRFGVPLVDGATWRLPRLVGLGRALDLILTGRPVGAEEALAIGLVNRVVEPGTAREAAEKLAAELAEWPQTCLRSDREAVYRCLGLPPDEALKIEFALGLRVIESGETAQGAGSFAGGGGRDGGKAPRPVLKEHVGLPEPDRKAGVLGYRLWLSPFGPRGRRQNRRVGGRRTDMSHTAAFSPWTVQPGPSPIRQPPSTAMM